MPHKPAAFLSYVHFDDDHERGKITEVRKRLSAEVRMQTGDEFPIFQDKDLEWGDNWRRRIRESLDTSTFFVPIITPGFFKSEPCLDELECFLKREKELGADNLVLPVYYVECSLLSAKDFSGTRRDKLVHVIASRQWFDWRELRFEPNTSELYARTIFQMAGFVRRALERVAPTPGTTPDIALRTKSSESIGAGVATAAEKEVDRVSVKISGQMPSKTEPPTHVVDDPAGLASAIKLAKAGDRILLRPGYYRGGIVVDKALEIIGDGPAGAILVESSGGEVVVFRSNLGRLCNLRLIQRGDGNALDIVQGRLEVEDCDISCDNGACVVIRATADPRLLKNHIHGAGKVGILVIQNGRGIVEDNDIKALALAGISVTTGANPAVRRNRIHEGTGSGIHISQGGLGCFEGNEIFGTVMTGVVVSDQSNPSFRHNQIHDSNVNGIRVAFGGRGIFEDNEIFDNREAGVEMGGEYGDFCQPTLRNNIIRGNEVAIRIIGVVQQDAMIEGNDLRGNVAGPWQMARGIENVYQSRNTE